MLYLVFVDDAKQNPTRAGISGQLVAVGGVMLEADAAADAEGALSELCDRTGFPQGEEFKWSPKTGMWMRNNLVGQARSTFFAEVAAVLMASHSMAVAVMEDDGRGRATDALDAEHDVIEMLFERVTNKLPCSHHAMIIADRPSGGRADEKRFVADCLLSLESGTNYVQHDRIAFLVTADSKQARLMQAADLVVSCMTAYVSGSPWAPAVAKHLIPLFPAESGRRGGTSLKLHPDFSFANLYHWLLGDTHMKRGNSGVPLPLVGRPYANGPDAP